MKEMKLRSLILISVFLTPTSSAFSQNITELIKSDSESKTLFMEDLNNLNLNKYMSSSDNFRMKQQISENWDGINWVPSAKLTLAYNSNGDQIELKTEEWEDGQWKNKLRDVYYYSDNLRTEEVSQKWNGIQWVDENKTLYTYDVWGYEISWVGLWWNNNEWNNITGYDHYRNNSTHCNDSTITKSWQSTEWKNWMKYFWIKDSQLRDSIVYNYKWSENSWGNLARILYKRDDSAFSSLIVSEYWNGALYYNSRKSYEFFDSSGRNLRFYSLYFDGKWRNDSQTLISYNSINKISEVLIQSGVITDPTGTLWQTNSRSIYSYDNNGNTDIVLDQKWSNESWLNYQRRIFSYELVSDVNAEIPIATFFLEDNYPNPFNPTTNIKFSLPNRNYVVLKIFDILGNEVATLVDEEKESGVYSVEFDGNFLVSGIYIYRLSSGNFIQSKKMLFLK